MTGQARFTYTDADMVATQRAGWRLCARWRNLLVAYAAMIFLNSALLAGLNLDYGTRPVPADPYAVLIGSAAEVALLFGLFLVMATTQGRQVLHKPRRFAWDGDALGGAQAWDWDADALHIVHDRGRADLAWTAIGAWFDAPNVLLIFPARGRPFSIPEPILAAGWRVAPKVFLMPAGGFALAVPKHALAAVDAGRLVAALRSAGARERHGLTLGAAKTGVAG